MTEIFLSAAMIVRNEERYIEDCLKSLKGVVDEIVVVDTGSTDGTKEIASRFGARIFDFPWRDDFSAARNESVEHCLGEWIIFIDADERLGPVGKEAVFADLSRPGFAGFTVQYRPISWFTTFREYRIFRNDPRIRFEGIIHETVMPSVLNVGAEDGLSVGHSIISIDHIGYDGDMARKHMRNLPLLERHAAALPENTFLRYRLGVTRRALGDTEGAEREWRTAIETVRRRRENVAPRDCQSYYDLMRLLLEKGEDVSPVLEEAEGLFTDNYLIIWTRAMVLMHGERYEEAAEIFERLTSLDPEKIDQVRISYDKRLFGEYSYDPLGTCYFKLGRLPESELAYASALERDPQNTEYMTKHKFVSALLQKTP